MCRHAYYDASGVAYVVTVFLRVERQNKVKLYLLQPKNRVAPIKKMTIPGLELLAACIGARVYANMQEVCDLDIECYFGTDSTTGRYLSGIKYRRLDI